MQREVAHRLFAQEFNASRFVIEGKGDKDPNFVLSPAGAKTNRVHVVGVCTDVEPVGDSGEVFRARVSDPTGVFTVYAGQYQPEAAHALSNLEPPQFVAVTGKARTYEPEPGSLFVSIRPEQVTVVDQDARDRWIVEAARRTKDRLKASDAIRANPSVDEAGLVEAGHRRMDAEGALLAQESYGIVDLGGFAESTEEALRFVRDGEVPIHTPEVPVVEAPPKDDLEDAILARVKALEGDEGAAWDDVLQEAAVNGTTAEQVEESLNSLMDKGLVYEPTLGVLKST